VIAQTDGVDEICDDLTAEHASLAALLELAGEDGFTIPTPAEGWSIGDQIAHLWFFDVRARWSMVEPERFAADLQQMMSNAGIDEAIVVGRTMAPAQLRSVSVDEAARFVESARSVAPSSRVPWYGPAMSARSSASARLMETWAHGQDVADALGVERVATSRVQHIARLAVRARPYAYAVHRRELPASGVSVILDAPDGGRWEWIDESSDDVIRGSAVDFCLVSVQRRHADDTDLVADGPLAREWLSIAQAFAGPAGRGRAARGR